METVLCCTAVMSPLLTGPGLPGGNPIWCYSLLKPHLIQVYEAIGETEGARVLRQQLEAENDSDEMHRLRVAGLQASMAGDLETALENFDQALMIEPEDADLYNDRGAVLARMERYEEAEGAFRKAEELAPEDPVVQENLARLYHRNGQAGLRDAALARWEELTGQEAPRPE